MYSKPNPSSVPSSPGRSQKKSGSTFSSSKRKQPSTPPPTAKSESNARKMLLNIHPPSDRHNVTVASTNTSSSCSPRGGGTSFPVSRPSTAPNANPNVKKQPQGRPVSSSITPRGSSQKIGGGGEPQSNTYYYNTSPVDRRRKSSGGAVGKYDGLKPPKNATTPRKRSGGAAGGDRPRALSVVLPPRDLIRSLSSLSLMEGTRHRGGKKDDGDHVGVVPVKIKNLHFASTYTPHKREWVKNALERLGGVWLREGKVSEGVLLSEEFEEKVGVLYDLVMAKGGCGAIDTLIGFGDEGFVADNKNFPFSPGVSESVRRGMSEALLKIMMRSGGAKIEEMPERTKRTDERKEENKDESSSNSFENSLKERKSLVQCYVVDGGRLVVGTAKGLLKVGGSFVNRFGGSEGSRGRKYQQEQQTAQTEPTTYPFYRRTANLMGFLPHEVKIRYCKDSRQIIVSGARPQRGENENARQVREVLEVPKNVDIRRLVVLRTGKGSLIFEEEEREA